MPDNIYLEIARKDFALLQEGRVSILGADSRRALEDILLEFNSALFLSNATAAGLDPSGKKSAATMQKEIDDAIHRCEIIQARELFSIYLPSGKPYLQIDWTVHSIQAYLSNAGKDFAALDPTGQASAQEMQHKLTQIVTAARLSVAKQAWTELAGNTGDVDAALNAIHAPGITLAILMPEINTEVERQTQLHAAAKKGYIRQAHEVLEIVARGHIANDSDMYLPRDMALEQLHENLTKAGVKPTILDSELPKAIKAGTLYLARNLFNHLSVSRYPDRDLAEIKHELKEAGAPLTALVINKISLKEIKQQINAALKDSHLARAQHYFELFMKGSYEVNEDHIDGLSGEIKLVRSELKKAGVDVSTLDLEHKKSTAEMEEIITQQMHDFGIPSTALKTTPHRPAVKKR